MDATALIAIIVTTIVGTMFYLKLEKRRFTAPVATLALTAVTFVTSAIGNLNPGFLHLLDRNGTQLLSGEWWRLVTPLFVQDGGWPGTIFNLVALVFVGLCAETLYRWRTFVGVYFVSGIISEVFAYTVLQHQGFAGNSVAVNGTAALCLVTLCALGAVPSRIVGVIGVLSGTFLLVTGNLHGVGFAVGALTAVTLLLRARAVARKAAPAVSGVE